MSAKDEILVYLQSLLAHHADCKVEQCSRCRALLGILESVRHRIFSGPVFPEVMMAERSAVSPADGLISAAARKLPAPRKQRVRGGMVPPSALPGQGSLDDPAPSPEPIQPGA